MQRLKRSLKFLRQTIAEFSDDDCTTMAAALAYYAVFSLPPLILIAILTASALWSQEAVEQGVSSELTRIVGESATNQILDLMRHARFDGKGGWATLVSAIVLFIGSTGIMIQLQTALNRVWETEPPISGSAIKNLILKRILSFAMVLLVGFLLLLSLVLTTVLAATASYLNAYLPGEAISWLTYVGHLAATLFILVLMLSILFRFLPDTHVHWKDVWVGSSVTAILFMLGKDLLGWYLGSRNPGSYGAAGALVLFLMWIYYTSLIILFGAEFTQVWAQSRGHRKRSWRRSARPG